ncbi:MAG: hypothetical protein PHC28_08490 [Flavobacterium sp.]|uniref:hypothetical protein n=1 Tax=Flavobacterium sp. TaxID=239 RepID=UPI0026073C97|nr:hypothetical protein [Flavobacterium sp.]MDD5150505.1 hypothetical protein [Flavobacterium sp.]
MKKLYFELFSIIIILVSCTPTDHNSNIQNPSNKVPHLIEEINGWHVLGGQRIPLSVGEFPMQLQYENGHLTQSYKGMFYANPNNTTYDFARSNIQGDSIFCRKTSFEYNPFFYKEADVSDVRYGVYMQTGLNGIGPSELDTNTQIHTFTSNVTRSYKFSNPNLFMYYDANIAGIKAYRIGTNQVIDLSSNVLTTFSDLTFKGTLDIDETYCKANPTHLKAYYASNNNGISYYGHSANYVSIYSVDDTNKTVFRDSTSVYRSQATGSDYKVSCNDANNVYFFFSNYTNAKTTSSDDKNVLLLVFNKSTQKIIQKKLIAQFSEAKEVVIIPAKNQLFINTGTAKVFKIDLSNYAITDISPSYLSGTNNSVALTTDGTKLYATVGSAYKLNPPAVTNVVYFE